MWWLLVAWTVYAQPATTISGTFEDPAITPAVGVFVELSLFGSGGFYLDDTTYTDSAGQYSFTYNLPQGSYNGYLAYVDCDGSFIVDSLNFTAPNTFVKDVLYCPNGPGSGNCDATFNVYLDTNQTAYTYNFVSIGPNSPSVTYFWSFGDGTTSTAQNPSHTYASTSAFYPACLTVYDTVTMCEDSTCAIIVIAGGSCSAGFSFSDNNGVVTFTSSASGSGSFTYSWDFGDGNTSAQANPVHTYANSGTYTVTLTITSSTGCTDSITSNVNVQILVPGSAKVKGAVFNYDSTGTVTTGSAYLIQYDSIGGTLTAIDTVDLMQGSYEFTNVFPGNYLVKAAAAPNYSGYASNLPTYYYSSLNWSTATHVVVNLQDVFASIIMQQGTNPGGPGFIGGLVSAGANKGPGDGLENIQINLFNDTEEAVAYTYTDVDGRYEFDDIPLGTYKLFVEIPGISSQGFDVVLKADEPSVGGVNFEVNESDVNIVTSSEPQLWTSSLRMFPNPASQTLNIEMEIFQTQEASLTLWNVEGKMLEQTNEMLVSGTNRMTLSLEDLKPGLYMVEVRIGEQTQMLKFAKN